MDPQTKPDAWFAGYFDADGSVGIAPPRDTSLYLLHISVVSVVLEPLVEFKERFGGKIIGPILGVGNRRPSYRWEAETRIAERALKAMLPWLVVKRERAELAMEFRELFRGSNILPRGPSASLFEKKRSTIMEQRQCCYHKMRQLNKRGIN